MLRVIGSTMPPLRAVIDGMPDASVTSVITSEYDTPSDVVPKRRTNNSAMRRARPDSRRTREIIIAASTSHTEGEEKPVSASAIGIRPISTNIIRPTSTITAPGSGCSIRPAMVARKIAVMRQLAGVTDSGRGRTWATTT